MNLLLLREIFQPDFTLGKLYVDNVQFCYTCEDTDRKLETDPKGKVHAKTAIPRGRYRVEVTFSNRFQKPLPLVRDVPGFVGVRLHGGNTADDTEGCPLLGRVRTADGVAQCRDTVAALTSMIQAATKAGKEVWLEVK